MEYGGGFRAKSPSNNFFQNAQPGSKDTQLIPEKLKNFRRGSAREIKFATNCLYFATAACAAAAASDFASDAFVSALANFGMLCILGRLYVLAPYTVAMAKRVSDEWVDAEREYVNSRFPWAQLLGRFGWICLAAGVFLQVVTGMR